MNPKKIVVALGACCGMTFLSPGLIAQTVLYSDNFDSGAGDAANWTINSGPGNNAATFGFNYSTIGIPSAPNSGGSTIGLKLEANYSGGVFGGLSVSPTGQSFSGGYVLTFNLWQNFVGPAPGGGSGSTQITGAGIGTAGTTAQWAGGTQDSVHFGSTGDGGSASDYRAYSSAAPTSYASGNAVYAAPSGAINNSSAYYASLGGNTIPSAQTTLFAQQNGTTAAGAGGFAWHLVTIVNNGSTVTYTIDSTLIATVNLSTVTLGGGNILFNQYDINAGSSADANVRNLQFGLIDNVLVTTVPEPATCALAGLGAMGLFLARRRRRQA